MSAGKVTHLPIMQTLPRPHLGSGGRTGRSRRRSSLPECRPPGKLRWPQTSPQLTTPTWTQVPFQLHTRGPPESPCGKGSPQRAPPHAPAMELCGLGGAGGQVGLGSHLAGVPALTPCAQHVLLDDLVGGVCRRVLIALVTDLVPHDGHLHLLQVVGRGQWRCREGLGECRYSFCPS